MGLSIYLFGEFSVWQDDVCIESWDSGSTKNLLKILASSRGQTIRLEVLCEYLWPNSENPDQALRFLRTCVHRLRRILEPIASQKSSYILTSQDGYSFSKDDNCKVDIEEFSAHIASAKHLFDQGQFAQAIPEYERAIALYKGDYLIENRYEEWASQAREYWRNQYVRALLDMAECQARLGHYRRAVELTLQAKESNKYREDIYRQAMFYHSLMGNRGEALRIYQACEKILVDELGVKPSPITQQLHKQILEGRILGFDAFQSVTSPVDHPVHHSLSRLPFVGREQEYSQLIGHIKKALQGQGSTVFIGGEAGAGKTRLVQEAIRFAQREFKFCLLQGRCTELGAKQPYQALLQALHNYLSLKTAQELEQLPSLSRYVLAPWLPSLESLRASDALPQVSSDQERLRFFTGVSQLLFKIAQTDLPILLFLDDLQWADTSTIDFLDYLVSHLSQNALLLTGTYRLEEIPKDHVLVSLLRRAARESTEAPIHNLRLSRISLQAIETLLKEKAILSSPKNLRDFSEYLHKESAGNPFFLVAVLQSLFEMDAISLSPKGAWVVDTEKIAQQRDPLRPREIQEVLLARIERLTKEERHLLELMSVVGQRNEVSILTNVWQVVNPETPLQFLERCEVLEAAQFIVNTEVYATFVHDRIRETVYESVGLSRRRWLHRSVAEAIEIIHRDSPKSVDSLLAHHYARADLPAKALPHLLKILKEAVAGYRNAEGLQLAQEAWEMTEKLALTEVRLDAVRQMQFEILKEKANVYHILGRRAEQEETLNRMLDLSRTLPDYKYLAETHLLRVNLFVNTGLYGLSQAEGLKCLKIAIDNNDLVYQHMALQQIGLTHWQAGTYAEAIDYLTKALDLQKSLRGQKNCAETLRYLGIVFLKSGQPEKAAESYQQALELSQFMNDRQERFLVLQDMGYMYWSTGRYEQANLAYEEVRQIAAEVGDSRAEANALNSLGAICQSKGKLESSLVHYEQAAKLHQRIGNVRVYGFDLDNIGSVYLDLGQHDQAQSHFEQALKIFQEIQWKPWEAHSLASLGSLSLAKKELSAALKLLGQAKEIYRQTNDQLNLSVTLRKIGLVHSELSQHTQAFDYLGQALTIARAFGSKSEEMQVLSAQSLTYLKMNDLGNALSSSLSALELLKKLRRFPHAQQILYTHHQILQSAGLAREARQFLHKAGQALLRRAKRIQNLEFRTSYLHNVPIHREILEAYERAFQQVQLSDAQCYELLRSVRWPNGVIAPCCGGGKVRVHGQVSRSSEKRYLCVRCKKTFSDRTGTLFANKNLSLGKLFTVLVLISHATGDKSAMQTLARKLEVHTRTAAKLYQELGAALRKDALLQELVQQLQKKTH